MAQVHANEDAEIDPNLDRRKRRKITPSSDVVSIVASASVDDGDVRDGADVGSAGVSIEAGAVEPMDSIRGSENKETTSPPRRSVRLSSTQDMETASTPSHQQLTINLSPNKSSRKSAEPAQEISTPKKKKTLRLSSDGRLRQSPKKSPATKRGRKPKASGTNQIILKNGRIAKTQKVSLPYSKGADGDGDSSSTGTRINDILEGRLRISATEPNTITAQPPGKAVQPSKATHPFFLGKASLPISTAAALDLSDNASTAQASDADSTKEASKPKAWSEIKFSSSKLSTPKDLFAIPSPWPPVDLQNHGLLTSTSSTGLLSVEANQRRKRKHDIMRITQTEDLLHRFTMHISGLRNLQDHVSAPERQSLGPNELLNFVEARLANADVPVGPSSVFAHAKSQLKGIRSAFDNGVAAGPLDWAHKYAPRRTSEVLQPQAAILDDWLDKMKVHHVQSKLESARQEGQQKVHRKRGRPKKKAEYMDDFIVESDEDIQTDFKAPKNAIVICGPHGCGKTASVYATAAKLDFEVFEIHPGMRRSAKDIFDRVGDMTHNHLVQRTGTSSREGDSRNEEIKNATIVESEVATGKQQTMAAFTSRAKNNSSSKHVQSVVAKQDQNTNQKQSVILLEEVDIIFEEDRGFWPGVQQLILQSKRPVIMTCNSLETIPLEELSLFATLSYDSPPVNDVVAYLALVSAAEGHLLQPEALSRLYHRKHNDLRATLMELDLWCQMTVGSKFGGLDWIPIKRPASKTQSQDLPRTVSCDTYRGDLDIDVTGQEPDEQLAFLQTQLDVSLLQFEELRTSSLGPTTESSSLARLDEALTLYDSRSCMDLLDSGTHPLVSSGISLWLKTDHKGLFEETMASAISKRHEHQHTLTRQAIAASLEPLMEDLRTFPPPIGRTAPSIDGQGYSLTVDVAPYVRSIVAFDQRLEEQRFELGGGSQGKKQRTTRAARAALEGGDKSNTRRERWYPKELDFDAVMRTGSSGWPQSQLGETGQDSCSPAGSDCET